MVDSDVQLSASRVLITDDDLDNQNVLGTFLRKQGFEPIIAINGSQALGMALPFLPKLAVIEMEMPGPSGTALAVRNKKRPTSKYSLLSIKATRKVLKYFTKTLHYSLETQILVAATRHRRVFGKQRASFCPPIFTHRI